VDDLRRKYQSAIAASRNAGLIGFVDERDGRLFIKGTVPTQAQANEIWTAIKHIPTWRYEVVADIDVDAGRAGAFPRYPDALLHGAGVRAAVPRTRRVSRAGHD